jgi:hypothetical protein
MLMIVIVSTPRFNKTMPKGIHFLKENRILGKMDSLKYQGPSQSVTNKHLQAKLNPTKDSSKLLELER